MMVRSAKGFPQPSPELHREAEQAEGRRVLTALATDARMEAALIPFTGSNSVGEPVERKLERLRADREAHSRKQIWTKDPHGGPYRKVNAGKGYDPLIQLPDGSERKAELGYERVKTGPTSNFVGNHMTQGAIDLVQAQLEPAPLPPSLLQLTAGCTGGGVPREAPRLLHTSAASEAAGAGLVRQLQGYAWEDEGDSVRLEVPLADLGVGSGGTVLACTIQPDRAELTLAVGGSAAGTGGSARARATAAGAGSRSHRLLLYPLHAAVVPDSCRCYLLGLPALECSSAAGHADADKAGPVAPRCTAVSNTIQLAAGGAPGGEEGGRESQQVQQQGQHQRRWSTSFAVPPSASAAVVQLAKADKQQAWQALQASLPLVTRRPAGKESWPDLKSLRKTVRQQLHRSKHPAPTLDSACMDNMAAPSTPMTAGPPAAASLPGDPSAACQAALEGAEALVSAGQHAEALAATAACLPRLAELPQWAGAARVHALRGRCHAQLGGIKQAIGDYTAAIGLAQAQVDQGAPGQQKGSAAWLCQLLVERAMLHEQQEQVVPALDDVLQASRLQAQPPAAVLLAAERLRTACRRAGRVQQGG